MLAKINMLSNLLLKLVTLVCQLDFALEKVLGTANTNFTHVYTDQLGELAQAWS